MEKDKEYNRNDQEIYKLKNGKGEQIRIYNPLNGELSFIGNYILIINFRYGN